MKEYTTVIEVWYNAENQEEANGLAKDFVYMLGAHEDVNEVDIEGEPEEQ